jgi:hypothetical protein
MYILGCVALHPASTRAFHPEWYLPLYWMVNLQNLSDRFLFFQYNGIFFSSTTRKAKNNKEN